MKNQPKIVIDENIYTDSFVARNSWRSKRFDNIGDSLSVSDVLKVDVERRETLIGHAKTHEIQQSKERRTRIIIRILKDDEGYSYL